jgi:hypothetical protein
MTSNGNISGSWTAPTKVAPSLALSVMSIGEPQVWQQKRNGCTSRFDMPMRQFVGWPQVSHLMDIFMFIEIDRIMAATKRDYNKTAALGAPGRWRFLRAGKLQGER